MQDEQFVDDLENIEFLSSIRRWFYRGVYSNEREHGFGRIDIGGEG